MSVGVGGRVCHRGVRHSTAGDDRTARHCLNANTGMLWGGQASGRKALRYKPTVHACTVGSSSEQEKEEVGNETMIARMLSKMHRELGSPTDQ